MRRFASLAWKATLDNRVTAIEEDEQRRGEGVRERPTLTATITRIVPGAGGIDKQLTKRELIVLEHTAAGKTSAEIAGTLFISRRTAEAHRANLVKKLGLRTQTDLVMYAIRNGIHQRVIRRVSDSNRIQQSKRSGSICEAFSATFPPRRFARSGPIV